MRKFKCIKAKTGGLYNNVNVGQIAILEDNYLKINGENVCQEGSVTYNVCFKEITQPTVKLVVEGLEIGEKVNLMIGATKADYCPYTWDGNTFIDNEGDKIMSFRLAKLISGGYNIERIEELTEEEKKLEEIEQSIVEQKEATAKLEKQAKELREMIDRD